MRIKEIYFKEFGPYRDRTFTPTADGVQLIYGPNESGKTSLLAGLRFLLFGKKSKQYGTGSGHLTVTRKDGTYHIGRDGKVLHFYKAGGEAITQEPSALWWHGLTKKTYDSIFGVTLDDLQGGDVLNEMEVRTRFFGAEGGEKMSSAVQEIEKASGELLVASANGKRKINVLMEKLKQIQGKIGELNERQGEYSKLQQELDGTDVTEKELRERLKEWQDYGDSIDLVLRAWDVYKRAEEAKSNLTRLADTQVLERDAFLALDAEINQCREHMRIWRGKEEGLVPDNFSPDSPIGIYASEIESLYQEISKWTQLKKECEQGMAYLAKVKEQLALSRRMHTMWRENEEMPADVNWRDGERLAGNLRSAREAYINWQGRQPEDPTGGTDTSVRAEEEKVIAKEKALAAVQAAYDAKQTAVAEVTGTGANAKKGKIGYGVAALLVILAVVAFVMLPAMPAVGGALIVLAIIAGGWGWRVDSAGRKALASVEGTKTSREETLAKLCAEQGWTVPTDGAAMATIVESVRKLREQLAHHNVALAQLHSFEQAKEKWVAEGKELEANGTHAMEAWQRWLPKAARRTLTDGDFFGMKQEYDSYMEQLNEYKGYEKRLQEHKDALTAIEERGAELWEKLNFTNPVTPVELRRVYSVLQSHRRNQAQWEQKESQRKNYREEYDQWSRKEKDLLLQQAELLQKSGIATAGEYRMKLLEQDRYRQWDTIYKQSVAQLELLAPKGENHELLYRRLKGDNKNKWLEESERCQSEINTLQNRLTALYEQRGRLQEALASLGNDKAQTAALQEQAQQEAELSEALEDWAAQALTSHFLDTAQRRYEKERQPKMLARASEYIGILTDGRYTLDTEAAPEALYLVDNTNDRVPPARWSSGLADQVYLALRLSLAKVFSERVESLPIILDDILVRFDEERQRAALKLLAHIGKTEQVLVFTCHNGTYELAKTVDGIDCYALNGAE